MDKYEFKLSLGEINTLIQERRFNEAANIADTIDWNHVKSANTLGRISEVYRIVGDYDRSRQIMEIAHKREPENPAIIYSLCELVIYLYKRDKLQSDLTEILSLMQEYKRLEPNNPRRLVLQYKMYDASGVSREEKIAVLEQLMQESFSEKWAYELAKLYADGNESQKAVSLCNEIEKSDRRYSKKATMLKDSLFDAQRREQREEQEARTADETISRTRTLGQEYPKEGYSREQYPKEQYSKNPNPYQEEEYQNRGYEEEQYQKRNQQEEPEQNGVNRSGFEKNSVHEDQEPVERKPYQEQQKENERQEEQEGQNRYREAESAEPVVEDHGKEETDEPKEDWLSYDGEPKEEDTSEDTSSEDENSINEVMQEWEKIRADIRRVNDEKRTQRILEDTGSLLENFDETARHGLLEDIEKGVEKQRRRVRSGAYRMTDEIPQEYRKDERSEEESYDDSSSYDQGSDQESAEDHETSEDAYDEDRNEEPQNEEPQSEELQNREPRNEEPQNEELQNESHHDVSRKEDERIPVANGDDDVKIYGETQSIDDIATRRWNAEEVREEVKKEAARQSRAVDHEIDREQDSKKIRKEQKEQERKEEEEEEQDFLDEEPEEEEQPGSEEEIKDNTSNEEARDYDHREYDQREEDSSFEEGEYRKEEEEKKVEEDSAIPVEEDIVEEDKEENDLEEEKKEENQPKKEEQTVKKEEGNKETTSSHGTHVLTQDERKLFGPFCRMKENVDQLTKALDEISLDSSKGNLLIIGNESTADRVARGILEIYRNDNPEFTGKVAKAKGESLNKLDSAQVERTFEKLEGGALIIASAADIAPKTMDRVSSELEKGHKIILILMDNGKRMEQFRTECKDDLKSFTAVIRIRPLDDKALVVYAKDYANSQDYSIDEFGQLALAQHISSMQTTQHHVTLKEVRDMVDEAIGYASKKSPQTVMEILSRKRYDEDDRIILHEKDFTHY